MINYFSEEDLSPIIDIIEKAEKTKLNVTYSPFKNNVMLSAHEQETELYLKLSYNNIIISRVQFKNKRQGTMTRLLKEIILIAHKKEIKSVLVESVLTKEMSSFCIKNGFIRQVNYFDEGSYYGNYLLELKKED